MGFFTEIESLEDVPQFEVNKVPVFDGERNSIPGAYSLQRADTGRHLGMVGESYRPIQMEEMVDVIGRASRKIGDIQHVGYTESKGGKKVVIQSKLPEPINVDGDKVEPYFYTVVDHSGMGSNKVVPSTIRISCDNAFHLIKSCADNRAHHASTFDDRVKAMIDSIVTSVESAKNFEGVMKRLKSLKFTKNQMVKLTQKFIPVEKDESTRRINKREKIVDLFESGRGNCGETRWDALNALTEYETHNGKQSAAKFIRNMTNTNLSRQGLTLLTAA